MSILNIFLAILGSSKKTREDYIAGKQLVRSLASRIPTSSNFAMLCELEATLDGKKQRQWSTHPISGRKSYDDEQKGIIFINGNQIGYLDLNGESVFNLDGRSTTFSTTRGRSIVLKTGNTEYEIDDLQALKSLYKNEVVSPAFAVDINYRDRLGLGELTDALLASGSQQI